MYLCRVKAIRSLVGDTVVVDLALPEAVSFQAGQYVALKSMSSHQKFYFSIANAPNEDREISLHIGAVTPNSSIAQAIEEWTFFGQVECLHIGGNAYWRDNQHPIICLAGGSGYAAVRGIIAQSLQQNPERSITLVWGGKEPSALYEHDRLQLLSERFNAFNYIPVLEKNSTNCSVKLGNVLEIAYSLPLDYAAAELYVCGRPEMVKKAYLHLTQHCGVTAEHFHSDTPVGD